MRLVMTTKELFAGESNSSDVKVTFTAGDDPVGYMLLSNRDDGKHQDLDWLEVSPSYRGRGLGLALIAAYESTTGIQLRANTFTLSGLRSIAPRFLSRKEIERRIREGDFVEC